MKAFKMHTRDLKFRRLFAFIFKFKPHHESILCYNSLKRHSSCQISVLELQFASKSFQVKLQFQFQGHFQGRLIWGPNRLPTRKKALMIHRLWIFVETDRFSSHETFVRFGWLLHTCILCNNGSLSVTCDKKSAKFQHEVDCFRWRPFYTVDPYRL